MNKLKLVYIEETHTVPNLIKTEAQMSDFRNYDFTQSVKAFPVIFFYTLSFYLSFEILLLSIRYLQRYFHFYFIWYNENKNISNLYWSNKKIKWENKMEEE